MWTPFLSLLDLESQVAELRPTDEACHFIRQERDDGREDDTRSDEDEERVHSLRGKDVERGDQRVEAEPCDLIWDLEREDERRDRSADHRRDKRWHDDARVFDDVRELHFRCDEKRGDQPARIRLAIRHEGEADELGRTSNQRGGAGDRVELERDGECGR